MKYPVYCPDLSGNEKKYVNECLDTEWISSKGHFVEDFEKAFAQRIGVKYATSVFNCTVGIHLIATALGLGDGDEVICPAFTYIASADPFKQTGCKLVFCDSEEDTWQLDPEDVERKITPKTKAIVVVHLYGNAPNMEKICSIARQHNLFLIEDCAEAMGTTYKGKHVGTFGDAACFSFFGNKTMTTGEGGMVVCNEPELYKRFRHLKAQGVVSWREYWHDEVAFNYRMTNIQAAIGLAQLERLDQFLNRKREIAKEYETNLRSIPLKFLKQQTDTNCSYWMVSCLTQSEEERKRLRQYLLNNGIETRPTFPSIHQMPVYSKQYIDLPIAQSLSERGINLPSYPRLTTEDVSKICQVIKAFYE